MMARALSGFAVALLLGGASVARAQEIETTTIRYLRGQSIQPVFEGWSRNADGSYALWFGYLNRNFEERPNIPAGPDNGFLGGEDLGQPEYFQTRRQQFVFKVTVPANWPRDKDLIWTVKANGTTLKAFGSLWPVWEIDEHTISANRGSRTAIDFDEPPNEAPKIVGAPPDQTASLGSPLTLTLSVTDDGNPKRRTDRGARVAGIKPGAGRGGADADQPPLRESLRVSWVQWKGPGTVRFDPDVVRVADGKATTTAKFDKPGSYVLRAYAEDAAIHSYRDINVTVTASGSAEGRR
ncbi:MAG: hypothetical protein HYS05_05490 [Acidobacteria bacterium]|nr:hypothetical protein [Acidobacteriota bacterium]